MKLLKVFSVLLMSTCSVYTLAAETYYALNTDTWNDCYTWTTDQSGRMYTNPDNVIPGVNSVDNVIIPAGKVVTYDMTSNINIGSLEILGELRLTGTGTINAQSLSGTGVLQINDLQHITLASGTLNDFIGTIDFATSIALSNCSYHSVTISGSASSVSISGNVTIDGDLTIKAGRVNFANNNAKLTVKGNILVESGAAMTSTAGSGYQGSLYVDGDFVNKGTLTFFYGNKPKHSDQNTSLTQRVVVYMTGSNDAIFDNQGTAKIFRIVCQKSDNVIGEITNSGSFTLRCKTADVASYEELPLVPKSGVMKLGSGITVSNWGANMLVQKSGYDTDQYPWGIGTGTMYIPEGAKVWIAGASVTVGSEDHTNGWQTYKGNVLIAGELEISSGTLTLSDGSWGIVFVAPLDGSATQNNASKFTISGGTVNTPRIVCYGQSDTQGRGGVYTQTGGTLNVSVLPCSKYAGNHSDKTFFLGYNSKFVMNGGDIKITKQISNSSYKGVNGMWLADGNGNAIESSVTAGTITFKSDALTDFKIYVPDVNFSNFKVDTYAKVTLQRDNSENLQVADLHVSNQLTVESNGILNMGSNGQNYDLYISKNIKVASGASILNCGTLIFDGSASGTYNVATTNNVWNNISIQKTSESALISTNQSVYFKGSLYAKLGNVRGDINMCGTSQQTIEDKCKAFSETGLTINNSEGVKLLTSTEFKSVTFSRNAIVNMGGYGFKVNTSLPTSGWSASRMFVTDNSTDALGLTVPAVSGKILPIGTSGLYGPVTIKYTSEGNFVTAIPVKGLYPNLEDGLEFYWRISSTAPDFTTSTNVYTVTSPSSLSTPSNLIGLYAYILRNDEKLYASRQEGSGFLGGFTSGDSMTYSQYTSGDYIIGSSLLATIFEDKHTYFYSAVASGNWKDKSWNKNSQKMTSNSKGIDIGDIDVVVIQSGTTITITGNVIGREWGKNIYARAGKVIIEKGGKLIIKDININQIKFAKIQGEGTLEFQYSAQTSALVAPTDYTDFCSNVDATIIYNMVGNDVSEYNSSSNLLPEYPNLQIVGSGKTFYIQKAQNTELKVNGSLTVGSDATFKFEGYDCSSFNVGKDVIVNGTFTMDSNNKQRLNIAGNIVNTGTMVLNTVVFLNGGITNNGTITASGNHVFNFSSGNPSGATYVVGGSAVAGNTNIQNIVIAKEYNNIVSFEIPIGNASGSVNLHIVSGTLNVVHTSNQEFHDFTAVWKNGDDGGLCVEGEYGYALSDQKAIFDIPAKTSLQLFNGANVNIACDRVRLAGSLNIMESSTLNVGDGAKNIGYVTATSTLRVGEGSILNISQLAPYESDATIQFYVEKNSTVNIGSGSVYGNYGVFDIRGGKCQLAANAVVNINNAASSASTNASLYYTPSTSSLAGSSKIVIKKSGSFLINAQKPLSNVTIESGVTASLLTNPLTIGNAFVLDGTLNTNNLDLTLKGNMTVAGTYNAGTNTTYFAGGTQTVNATNPLTFNNIDVSCTKTLNLKCATTTNNKFTIKTGTVALTQNATVLGDFESDYQTVVNGNGAVVLCGSSQQAFFCEGSIKNLYINNSNGISSAVEQAYPIVITGTLDLQNGQFSIGGNLLELGTDAQITSTVGDFGLSRMITTNTSLPDRGIRLNLSKGTHNVFLPLGGATKYSPVELNNVVVGTAGYITFVGTDHIYTAIQEYENYAGDALKYYWSVKEMNNIKVTSGSLIFRTSLSDAAGFPKTGYGSAFLNMSTGLWTKMSTDCEQDGSFIKVTFQIKGNATNLEGIYTAGVRDQLPDEVLTYISVANGNWTDAIWKKYSLKTSSIIDNTLYDPESATDMNGCGIVIGSGTTVQMASTDRFMDLCFVNIEENAILNAGLSKNNNAGYIRGEGKLIVQHSNAMLGGNYDKFFAKDCGTIEYAGTDDYYVYVYAAYANDVIFSGSGKRYMRNDVNLSALGDVVLKDDVEVVLQNNKSFALDGNITINGGKITGTGLVSFVGDATQYIKGSVTTANVAGIQLNNERNVISEISILVDKLSLSNGILSFTSDDKSITVNQSGTSAIVGGSATSYVDGWLCKKLSSGTAEPFPVGNLNRYATTKVTPSTAGIWRVRYVNTRAEFVESADNEVQSIGNEYWKIQGPSNSAQARITLRWDEQSGGIVNGQTKVAYYDGAWKSITYTNYSGTTTSGNLKTNDLVTYYNNGPRLYAFAVSQELTDTRWTGIISSDWDTGENWSNGIVPSMYSSVIIPFTARQPIIETNLAAVQDIEIQSGAILTLQGENSRFEVTGEFVNNGDFVLIYDYDAMPKFVFTGTYTGNKAKVYRSFSAGRLYYIGSATQEGTFESAGHTITSSDNFKSYDDAGETFTKSSQVVGTKNSIGSYTGSGYLGSAGTIGLRGDGDEQVLQVGTLQKATPITDVKLSTVSQWSWISNPYPFALNTKNALAGNKSIISPSVYFRTIEPGQGYSCITYNITNGISTGGSGSVINPFEAVCVEVVDYEKGDKKLKWAVEEAVTSTLKAAEVNVENDVLRLELSNAGNKDESALLFNEDGQMTYFDGDSHKYELCKTKLSIQKDNDNLTIANYPEVAQMTDIEIPIKIEKGNTDSYFTIEATNIQSFTAANEVYLVDHLTGEKINLRETPIYDCNDDNDIIEGRFAIVVGNKNATIETPTAVESVNAINNIVVYSNENAIVIRTSVEATMGSIAKVYDVAGKLILQAPLTDKRTEIQMPQQGVYVVEAISGDNKKIEKLLID